MEFRKALADGKTIQVSDNGIINGIINWVDLDNTILTFNILIENKKPVEEFRIKTDKPKFKAGDIIHNCDKTWFLQIKGTNGDEYINNVLCGEGRYTNEIRKIDKTYTLWKPEDDELVAVYDTGHDNFVIIGEYGSKCYNGVTIDENEFDNIRPYFGQLEDLRV